ncbi:hypothetical protein BBO99_00005757 [Phytophthora kernoviae]|uniref:TRP C-terminal domain-containing protein n=2 Tax=Phytophthora kernoviae TaxID=325452 RepID=A0A421GMN8_9STRA|nr:hypothetical protein G195_006346 [Phytophthora kernoviae 00238/432]KAG2524972.1 hypothetical protein JM18_005075 [Phytophthora kernoviae]KAG2525024.1 hypothetical protein JM16_004724 [Phytophthora kernoviae]RLN45524.1 hypothetical protein BBI17_005769 [Phytophthora kernoviae]RLN78739.1 hypothetical protein BBO99_00005757 [Phytophthora kernoviae]
MKVRRGGVSRLRKAAGLLLVTSAMVSANTAPSLYDYEYDGKTTYCYWMDQGMQVSNFDFAYVLGEGTNSQCPLTITLEQATTGTILAGGEVEYAFTATLNLNDNIFNITELETTVPDPTTGLPMQIGHANIHTCSRSTVCDIFRTGSNRKIAEQETSNFTSAGTASFRQKITYSSSGERNVFAHIILPPTDYLKESYHFITFITTNVEESTTSVSDEESSGLSTGATVGLILGAVAFVLAVILSVVFWRRKRRPGEDTDHFRNSGFGLPASYVVSKSKSHLDWNADPEARLGTSNGSAWKDNYSAGDHSRGSRGPGLNASALAFQDRHSRANQTVSSSGSIPSMHSSRGPGDIYNNFGSPTIQMQRSGGNFHGSRSGRMNQSDFNQSQSMYPDGPDPIVYDDDGKSIIIEEDPNFEFGRTPDLETFGLHDQGPSFESETSMGTSYEYSTDEGSNYGQPPFNPLLSGYGRESDLSSMGETEEYDMYEHPPPRMRGDTLDGMLAADNEGSESDIRGGSESSIGTVDFTQDEPSVRTQAPIFQTLDETLTLSGYAKSKAAASGEFAISTTSTDFASTNSSDNTEFVIHDQSNDFATTNASTDFSSTVTTSEIDIASNSEFASTLTDSEYATGIDTSEFTASSNADFTSNIGTTVFGASSNGDIAESTIYSELEGSSVNSGLVSDFNSDLAGSSYGTDMEGSSYGTDMEGSSYGTDMEGSSYGTNVTGFSYNTNIADSELGDAKTEADLNTTGVSDFDDSFATTTSEDTTTSAAIAKKDNLRTGRSPSDDEYYEF